MEWDSPSTESLISWNGAHIFEWDLCFPSFQALAKLEPTELPQDTEQARAKRFDLFRVVAHELESVENVRSIVHRWAEAAGSLIPGCRGLNTQPNWGNGEDVFLMFIEFYWLVQNISKECAFAYLMSKAPLASYSNFGGYRPPESMPHPNLIQDTHRHRGQWHTIPPAPNYYMIPPFFPQSTFPQRVPPGPPRLPPPCSSSNIKLEPGLPPQNLMHLPLSNGSSQQLNSGPGPATSEARTASNPLKRQQYPAPYYSTKRYKHTGSQQYADRCSSNQSHFNQRDQPQNGATRSNNDRIGHQQRESTRQQEAPGFDRHRTSGTHHKSYRPRTYRGPQRFPAQNFNRQCNQEQPKGQYKSQGSHSQDLDGEPKTPHEPTVFHPRDRRNYNPDPPPRSTIGESLSSSAASLASFLPARDASASASIGPHQDKFASGSHSKAQTVQQFGGNASLTSRGSATNMGSLRGQGAQPPSYTASTTNRQGDLKSTSDEPSEVQPKAEARDCYPIPSAQGRCDANERDMLLATPNDETDLKSTLHSIGQDCSGQHPTKPPATQPIFPRPPLRGFPPIWAQTRQEVCETFEWFRSYQGGVYFANDIAKGYLLGAFGAKRDIFAHNGRLIISHGGGRAESIHTENGRSTLRAAEDQQADDKSVRALLKTFREGRPLALIIDDRYPRFLYDLGSKDVTYAVLGFYMIVHAWAEYQSANTPNGRIIKYKFAFQWCEGQGEPWWLSETGHMEKVPASLSPDESKPPEKIEECDLRAPSPLDAVSLKCRQCKEDSPHVYSKDWACLNPSCCLFWKMRSTGEYMPEELAYQEDFLRLQKPCYLPIGFDSLRPPLIAERSDGITTSHSFTRGFHCSKCGRLSCRSEWRQWRCSTPGCENSHRVPAKVHDAKDFLYQTITAKFDSCWLEASCGVIKRPLRSFFAGNGGIVGHVQTYVLPEDRGCLHHIQSASPLSKLGANEIFKAYQKEANDGKLLFRRWPMRAHKCRGALLTNYFSHNAGEPYHYVGGTENTVPFDEAPSAVVDARAFIQDRIHQALGKEAIFNEVLSAAYMEKQKMAFHSDNEIGLGPLVAGLSMGSPAFIHFRMQRRHTNNGREQKGTIMSFILRHGDIFVMEGAGVQDFYDHTVVPTNFRIAATARYINPRHDTKPPAVRPCSVSGIGPQPPN